MRDNIDQALLLKSSRFESHSFQKQRTKESVAMIELSVGALTHIIRRDYHIRATISLGCGTGQRCVHIV